MIAACYDLSLQCDAATCYGVKLRGLQAKAQFTGEFGSDCRKRAREAGWRMWPKRGLCICPSCALRGAGPVEP